MGENITKVFITGASGLLGRQILEEASKNYSVVGTAFSRTQNNLVKCDLRTPGEVEKLIQERKPNFIVHAAAERYPDKVEKDLEAATLLNVTTSKRLATVAKKVGSKLIYISTDYVFDGSSSTPYKATDTPNPLNNYGITKYEGEKAVLEENSDAIILRIPVLYGPVEKIDESAVTYLLPLLFTSEAKSVSDYEKRFPSHTQDIAKIICALIKLVEEGETVNGVYQWSGKEKVTKYEMVKAMADVFSLPHDHITPDPNPAPGPPRPYHVFMDGSKLEDLGIIFHTNFKDGIKECLEPWVKKLKN